MQTREGVKQEKISHLKYCLEKLQYKDNGLNESKVVRLYTIIYNVINEMEKRKAEEALEHFKTSIDDDIRKELLSFNIELMV